MVGGCEVIGAVASDRDLHRRRRGRSADPVPASRAARPSARRRARRPPAARCTGTNSSSTIDVPAAHDAHRVSGPGTSRVDQARTIPRTRRRARPPARCRPAAGRPSSGGMTASSSTAIPPPSTAVNRCRWATTERPIRDLGADDGRPVRALDRDERPGRCGRGPSCDQRWPRPAIRSLSVGARQRLSSGGRPRRGMDEAPLVVELDRPVGIDHRLAEASRSAASRRTWSTDTSKAAGAQDESSRVRVRTVSQRSLAGSASGSCQRRDVHDRAAARRERRERQVAVRDDDPVVGHLPLGPQPGQVAEVLPVGDREAAAGGVLGAAFETDGPREVLVLPERGLRRAVREDEAVGAEVEVVRLVAEVAAVRPARRAVGHPLDAGRGPTTPR